MSTNLTADGVRLQYLKISFICGNKSYVKKFWMQKVLYMANKYFWYWRHSIHYGEFFFECFQVWQRHHFCHLSWTRLFSREFSDVISINIKKKKLHFICRVCYFQRLCDKHIHRSMYKSTETSEKPPLADFPEQGTVNFQCARKSWNLLRGRLHKSRLVSTRKCICLSLWTCDAFN